MPVRVALPLPLAVMGIVARAEELGLPDGVDTADVEGSSLCVGVSVVGPVAAGVPDAVAGAVAAADVDALDVADAMSDAGADCVIEITGVLVALGKAVA